MSDTITPTGKALYDAWKAAEADLAAAQTGLVTAQAARDAAANAFAGWILPTGTKPGETIGIRHGALVLTATLGTTGTPTTIAERTTEAPE